MTPVLLGRRRDVSEIARFIPDCIVTLFKQLLGDRRVPRRATGAVAPMRSAPSPRLGT